MKELNEQQKTHQAHIEEVAQEAIGGYASSIGYTMELNDEDDDATAFLVTFNNVHDKDTVCVVMQGSDEGNVEILYGEEFDEADATDLLRFLFISLFIY